MSREILIPIPEFEINQTHYEYLDCEPYDYDVGDNLYSYLEAEYAKYGLNTVEVYQGYGESSDRDPLVSDGFSKCSGLILINPETQTSTLFHIEPNNLTERQYRTLIDLKGSHIAVPVQGTISTSIEDLVHSKYLKDMVLIDHVCSTIRVNTDMMHWGLSYVPRQHQVEVVSRALRKIFKFGIRELEE